MSTYLGWTVQAYPTVPATGGNVAPGPKSIESNDEYISAANTNPFTAQQQLYDWGARHREISVSYAALTKTQAQALIAFLVSLNGMMNVFQFPTGISNQFPETLESSGTPRYWRLKTNRAAWSIKVGPVYSITFELREAK